MQPVALDDDIPPHPRDPSVILIQKLQSLNERGQQAASNHKKRACKCWVESDCVPDSHVESPCGVQMFLPV